MKKHNGIVALWKFIFAIVIAFFHTNNFYPNYENPLFRWGYIAVEFYFIITGFYFAKQVMKEKYDKNTIGKDTFNFIKKRIKVVIIPVVIIYIIDLIGIILYSDFHLHQFVDSIWSLLLLRNLGVGKVVRMRQLWYLTIMFVVLYVLYPLLKKYKSQFIYLVSPIIVLFGLGFIGNRYGSMNVVDQYEFLYVTPSFIRGIVDVNIGMIIFLINDRLKDIDYTKFGKLLLTLFGEGLLIAVVLITTFIKNAYRYDFIMLLMLTIAISIIVSEKTLETKILSNCIIIYLERISILIFINHMTFNYFANNINLNISPLEKSLLSVVVCILFSMIEDKLIYYIKSKGFKWKEKIIKA